MATLPSRAGAVTLLDFAKSLDPAGKTATVVELLTQTNAMLPDLGPRAELGRISGSGWALGYVGGVVSLVLVLGFFAPGPSGGATLLGLPPLEPS